MKRKIPRTPRKRASLAAGEKTPVHGRNGADPAALLVTNPWQQLRRFTPARIALGRAGSSLPTRAVLDFALAHAQARDAVHQPLDVVAVETDLKAAAFSAVRVHSAAASRMEYLRRPDLGRRLDSASREKIGDLARNMPAGQQLEAVFVIADGLSARAAGTHAVPVLRALQSKLQGQGWRVVVAEQARVALADEIGELLSAPLAVILIGERPGLSSPDSLGIYMTHAPRIGRTDAERNCISNVRPEGLGYEPAAARLAYLLRESRRLGYSGIRLKDTSAADLVMR